MTSLKSANSNASGSVPDEVSTLGDWDDREERRLVRKIDFRCLVGRFPRSSDAWLIIRLHTACVDDCTFPPFPFQVVE
jgi:hypothetical protein